MIFVDYIGPADRFVEAQSVVARNVAMVLRIAEEEVSVRRIVTEGGRREIELWVELSTDEQLYRLGQELAERVSGALREHAEPLDVWVMYRIVPLSQAFLNGERRGRGVPAFD